jgi:hypothetical protein
MYNMHDMHNEAATNAKSDKKGKELAALLNAAIAYCIIRL